MQTTHSSAVSVVLVARAAPNADMSLIWLSRRLQGRSVNNGRASTQKTHSSVVSVALVAKAVSNADISLIWLFQRLENQYINNGHTNKKPASRQPT